MITTETWNQCVSMLNYDIVAISGDNIAVLAIDLVQGEIAFVDLHPGADVLGWRRVRRATPEELEHYSALHSVLF